jgi:molybdenum cofactor guanylyltransferase
VKNNGKRLAVQARLEIFILAGGLSSRMGRDKARIKLGGRTLLAHVKAAARATGLKVFVVRQDCIPRCGPLGGILTALRRTKARAVLFLACDMPFVTTEFLNRFRSDEAAELQSALFARSGTLWCFPFRLPTRMVDIVTAQIARERFGIQSLGRAVSARTVRIGAKESPQLRNINTPEDLAAAECLSAAFEAQREERKKSKRAASLKKSLLS